MHERFGTDLTHLYEEWSEHFGPEGMPLSKGLVIISAAVAGGFAFSILNDFVEDVVAGVVAAAAVVVASIWVGRKAGFIETLRQSRLAKLFGRFRREHGLDLLSDLMMLSAISCLVTGS